MTKLQNELDVCLHASFQNPLQILQSPNHYTNMLASNQVLP